MKPRCDTYFVYRTWLGDMCIGANASGIAFVSFETFELEGVQRRATAATNAASTQILEYFAGKRQAFDLNLSLEGSVFMLQVLGEVTKIPYGTTATARDIAIRMDAEASYRSVGRAIRANPLKIIIPTHRIVDANGHAIGTRKQAQHAQALIEFEARRS